MAYNGSKALSSVEKETFCQAYVNNGFNAKAAYATIRPDCTPQSQRDSGYRMMGRPEIRKRIQELSTERFDALAVDGEKVLIKLSEIAFSTPDDEYYNANAQLKALDMIQKQLGLQNQKVAVNADINAAVKISDDYGSAEDC